ncbi:MAG TPA: efflux transporter outer membrane subunit [Alphaproteobacteria bacterium]|nr:efflux transporter outer membrane subunit [Alphaproteobacteria bacterium]
MRKWLGLCLAALVTSCTVGPDFKPPEPEQAPAWSQGATAPTAADSKSRIETRPFADSGRWWSIFGDPVLNDLISKAMAQNLDVQTAIERITEARAQRDITAAGGLPQLSFDPSYTRTKVSQKGVASSLGGGGRGLPIPGALLNPFDLFQWAFDATWEVDLWGKVRRGVEAADADIQSAEEHRNDMFVSLAANIARTYLDLRAAQTETTVTEENLTVERDVLNLTRSRAASGLATQLDVANAGAQVASTEAQLPPLRARIRQDANQLALLLARPPGSLDNAVNQPHALPALPSAVAIGLPGDLLRRRPDIRGSEAELHAATARIGVAASQLFPSLTLTGGYGLQGTRFNDLKDWNARFYSIGPSLSVPIFEGGRLRAQVELADAQAREAALSYRNTVLSAYQDAENALVAYNQEQERAASLRKSRDLNRDALALARSRYQSGLVDFLTVLDAERNLYQAETAFTDSNEGTLVDLVAVYKALGGGWEGQSPASARKDAAN